MSKEKESNTELKDTRAGFLIISHWELESLEMSFARLRDNGIDSYYEKNGMIGRNET